MNVRRNLRAANFARQAEWDPGAQITLAYRGNELGGECGEAQNVIKKLERERLGIRGSRATREQLADELADVVICADLIAMSEGIDLDDAVATKFNATSEKIGLKTRLAPAHAGWRDTITAPRGGDYVQLDPRPGLPWRLTLSDPIALLCRDIDAEEQFAIVVMGCWSTKDDEAGWWNLDAEEPLDLDVLGWMPLRLSEVEPSDGAA